MLLRCRCVFVTPSADASHVVIIIIIIIIMGPINESATCFLHDLGWRISLVSGEDREPQFLFQRISVAIQRFNDDGFCLPTTRISAAPDSNLKKIIINRNYTRTMNR